jgi:hypothetical protein
VHFGQKGSEFIQVKPQIDESSQDHIATNPGKTVKVSYFHNASGFQLK